MSEFSGIYLVLMILKILVAIFILKRAIALKNEIYLELGFIFAISSIGYITRFIDDLNIRSVKTHLIGTIATAIGIIIALHWINRVFYTDRKSPYKKIMIIIVLFIIPRITFFYLYQFIYTENNLLIIALDRVFFGAYVLIFGGWFFYATAGAYNKLIFKDKIEPWIIMRYKTIMLYSICYLTVGISYFLIPLVPIPITSELSLFGFIALIMYFLETVGEFLAWFMPKKLKNFYNRKFTAEVTEELSEEEIIKLLEKELS